MRHRLLYSSPTLELEYDLLDDFLHARWGSEQTLDTIRAGYEQILAEMQRTHCHRLLDDQRLLQGLWADLADWVADDWYPRARQSGLNVHTVVYSTDFFGRRSTELALARVGGLIAGFDTEEAARRALLAL